MIVAKNKVVGINYALYDESHRQLESNAGYAPLVYLHGAGNVVPGLEEAMEGMARGETREVLVGSRDRDEPERSAVTVGDTHPLAGRPVFFKAEVVFVRDAQPGEMARGFPLGDIPCGPPGCC